jgi:hypothetical protein
MVILFIRGILRPSYCFCFKPFASLISHHALEKAAGKPTEQIDKALPQKLKFVLEENPVYRTPLDRQSFH